MKKRVLAGIVIFSVLCFLGCKKPDLSTPVIYSSQWQYGGITYYGDTTNFSGGSLISDSKTLNEIEVRFMGRPTESGTYSVSSIDPISSTDCVIEGDYLATALPLTFKSFKSIGADGNTVQVSVADDTKLVTVVFKNVAVADGSQIKYVSGTLIEKP